VNWAVAIVSDEEDSGIAVVMLFFSMVLKLVAIGLQVTVVGFK